MSFGRDPLDFKISLKASLREYRGPTGDQPHGLRVGFRLMDFLNRELGEENLLAFLRCAETASQDLKNPERGLNLYSEHLSRTLRSAGFPEDDQKINAAWHVFLALHRIAGQDHCDLLIRCGIEALEQELAAV